jgi:hypothetical protein
MAACKPVAKNDLRMLEPKKVHVKADPYGRLSLELGIEERYGPVRVLRCMPLTQPDKYISVQDDEGNEIGILDDLQQLDPESRRAVEQELDFYYLRARVKAIRKVESKNGIISWEVDTEMGPKTVHVRDRQHIRPLGDGRTILTDIHEAKYEIPPFDTLDEKSRHWLEIEL